MTPPGDTLEHAASALRSIPRGAVTGFTDSELLAHVHEVEQLGRLVDALRVEVAAEVDVRSDRFLGEASLSRRHGHRTGASLIEQVTGVSAGEAARRVRIGTATTPRFSLLGEVLSAPFELVGEAVCAGSMSLDAAAVIIRHLTEASRAASPASLRIAETHLVDQASHTPTDLLAVHARQLCAALDPDGVEPRESALRQRRSFRLGREVDGMTPFSGVADPVNAGLLRAALAQRTAPSRQPRFLDPDDHSDDIDGSADPSDTRSRDQRAFDIVFGLLMAGIRADNQVVGSLHGTATVEVVVRAEDLVNGTGAAWIDDVLSPIPTATTRELICDGGVTLHIENSKGRVLWEGRRERYFTAAQRKALAVRDGGCIWPQCTAPPSWCHAHHVLEWEHGGRTDMDNGALLCSFHHHLLHSSDYRLRMNDGCPELLRPRWLDPEQEWMSVTRSRLALTAA